MNTNAEGKPRNPLAYLAPLAAFAVGSLFASGKWAMPIAAWLTPVFGLRVMRQGTAWKSFLALYVAAFATQVFAWAGATPFPTGMHVVTIAIGSAVGTLTFLADRLIAPRIARNGRQLFASTLVFPIAGTALEFFVMNDQTIGSIAASSYGHAGATFALQSLSLVGMTGLTFLVLWTASVINWVWERGFDIKRVGWGVATYVAIMALVLGYGAARLVTAPAPDTTVAVASFTAHDINVGEMLATLDEDPEAFRAQTQGIHADYLSGTKELAEDGARIITWPEIAGIGVSEDVDELLGTSSELADEYDIYLAVPVFEVFPESDRPIENRVHLFDPEGESVLVHVKFGGNAVEGTLEGEQRLQSVDTPYGRIAMAICWDADYPMVVAQAGREDVDILLSPAMESKGLTPLHADVVTFRAAENGMSVVRQADKGLSVVVDPYGRVVSEANHFTADERLVKADVSTAGVRTIYPNVGDLVGLVSVLGLALLLIWSVGSAVIRRVSRRGDGPSSP